MITDYNNLLFNKILTTIKNSPETRITFADYMQMCLYDHELGYYNRDEISLGKDGDFFTSASLSKDFGELLAEQFWQFWQKLEQPDYFQLVEMGAGEGKLAQIILTYLKKEYISFYEKIEYIIIEKSISFRNKQKDILQKFNKEKNKIKWLNWSEIDRQSIIGCFFSNELLDAFPVHLVKLNNDKLQEIYIQEENNNLVEVRGKISTEKIKNYFNLINLNLEQNIYPDNYQTEVNLQALSWLEKVASKLKQGYLLTIDYGYTAEKYYHPQRSQGTLQCYYQHRYHNNPFVNIGRQDITTHVNFTALSKYGESLGLDHLGYTQQALFLMSLGLGERLNALSNGKISFQQIWQKRNQLHELINPEGLGNFGVLLQGKNLIEKQTKFSAWLN